MHWPAGGPGIMSEIRGDPPPAYVLIDEAASERASRRAGQQRQRHAFRSERKAPAGWPMPRMGAPWQHVWRGAMPGVRRLASTGRRPDVTRDQPRAPPGHRPPTKARPGLHIHLFDSISVCARAPVPCPVATNNLLLLASCYCEDIEAEILRLGGACPYAERTPRYYTVQALTGLTTARSGGDR